MYTRDDWYCLQGTLSNLMLLKVAYDAGINMDIFNHYRVDFNMVNDYEYENFLEAIDYLFEIVHHIPAYEEEYIPEKKYWAELVGNVEGFDDSVSILIILDDKLSNFEKVSIGGHHILAHWYMGYGEIQSFENGMAIIYSEEDGPLEWNEVLYIICNEILAISRKDEVL